MAFGDLKGTFSGSAGSITGGTLPGSGSVAVNANDLIVVMAGEAGANTVTGVTTGAYGLSLTPVNAGTLSTAGGRLFYGFCPSAGTILQITGAATNSADDWAIVGAVFEGPFSAIDRAPANTTDFATPFTCAATGTLSQANEIIIAGLALARGQTVTTATSPLLLAINTASGANTANSVSATIGRQVVAATTSVTPVFASSGTINGAVQIVATFAQGTPSITGTLAVTETPDAITSAVGTVNPITGVGAGTESGDTLVAAGGPVASGTLTATESGDTLSAAGTVAVTLPPITGTIGGTADPNTVLLCHADDPGAFYDSSLSAHALMGVGSAIPVVGQYKFGGRSAYLVLSPDSGISILDNATDFNFGAGPFTVEAWCYFTSNPTSTPPIICQWPGASGQMGWIFTVTDGNIRFHLSTNGTSTLGYTTAAYAPPLNTWVHLAVDRDATNTLRTYVNGAVLSTDAFAYTIYPSTLNATIGNYTGGANAFPGYLDEVRVSKGVARFAGAFTPPTTAYPDPTGIQAKQTLSAAGTVGLVTGTLAVTQVSQTLSAAGTVGVALPPITGTVGGAGDPNTLLLLHADGTNGSTSFTDASSYAHTLTPVGTAQITTANPKFGTGSAIFNASANSGIDTNNVSHFQFGSGPFTVETWFYYTTGFPTGAYKAMACQWWQDPQNSWWFGFDNGNSLAFLWSATGSYDGAKTINYPWGAPANTWAHLAVERDASNVLRLYVNGAVVNSTTVTDSFFPSTQTAMVGTDHAQNYFLAQLDEVRISNVARYGGAFTPPTAPFSVAAPLVQANQTLSAAGTVGTGPASVTGTLAVTEANETIVAAGTLAIGGTLSANQAAHTIVAVGGPRLDGTLARTQAGQTISAIATVRVDGALTQTQASHTIVAAGGPRASGTLATNQAAHALVSAGTVTIGGTLAQTQASETLVAAGSVLSGTSGSLNVTQASQALAGAGVTAPITLGSLNVTQAAHGFVAAGTVAISATLSQTQAAQSLVAAGGPSVTATLSLGQAGQSLAASGGPRGGATLAASQAPQSLLAAATLGVSGNLSQTQASHTLSGVGRVTLGGVLTASQAPQTLAATGAILTGLGGDLIATQASHTLVATGVGAPIAVGSLNVTQATHGLAAAGTVRVSGTLATTQAGQTLSATAQRLVEAAIVATQASETLVAAGGVTVNATLARTQADQTIGSTGKITVGAALNLIQDSQIVLAHGGTLVLGSLARAEAADRLSASGRNGTVAQTRVLMLA